MTLQENLSNALNAVRKTRDLTITEFSEELGISRTSTQSLLNGTCNPRMDTLEQIADRLQIKPSLLISSSFSEEQWRLIFALFDGMEAFGNLPEGRKQKAAVLICELIHVFSES